MLAGFRGLDRPGDVKLVWKRIVDGFDLRIGQKLFVRSVGLGDAKCAGYFFGPAAVARGNRSYLAPLAFLHSRDDFLNSDRSRAQNSPANFVSHKRTS